MTSRFLEECEREALHLCNAVQAHGALLIARDNRVTHVSANWEGFFREPPTALLDQPLPEPLSTLADDLPAFPGAWSVKDQSWERSGHSFDLVLRRGAKGESIFEIYPTLPQTIPAFSFASDLRLPESPEDLATLRQRLLTHVAKATGAGRVLYYQFLDDGDGLVLDEQCAHPSIGSYLGLRFPASDIPAIARMLYVKNPWRYIPYAAQPAVPLLGEGIADLTYCDLRALSDIHRQYLANMGVAASLSFPIVITGSLVALITAHAFQPFLLSPSLLASLAAVSRDFSLRLAGYQAARRMRLIDGLAYRFDTFAAIIQRHGDFFSGWAEAAPLLLDAFSCQGAILCDEEQYVSHGLTLEAPALAVLDGYFCNKEEIVALYDSLNRSFPSWPVSAAAGALCIRADTLRLYLLREEWLHEVAWGGNPNKPVEYIGKGTLPIAPRRSFEKWVEKRIGYCRPWDNEMRLLAFKLRERLLELMQRL